MQVDDGDQRGECGGWQVALKVKKVEDEEEDEDKEEWSEQQFASSALFAK